MSARRLLPRLALLLLLVAAAAWAAFHRDQINLATLDAWLGSLGLWAPVGYVVALRPCDRRLRSRRDFRPGRRRFVRAGLGQHLEPRRAPRSAPRLAFLVARYIAGDWVERKAGGCSSG